MFNLRNITARGALAFLIGAGSVAAGSSGASADVVCNRFGDCWHTRHHYHFPVRLGVRFYSDGWQRGHNWEHDRYRHWRGDRDERGYWRNGVWINF